MTVSGGAGSPQLKLQVALDLTFLRSQLAGLGRTVGDVPFSVVPTLDLRQLKRDINRLQKDIVININDSQVGTLNAKLVKAKEKLDLLRGEKIVVGVTGEASVTQREARRIRAGVKRGVLSQGGKILLPVGLQSISDSVVNKFKADLQRRLGTVTVGVTGETFVTQGEARRIRAGVKRGVLSQGGKILLPVGLQPIPDSVVDKFKADLQRRLGTVTVGVKANLEATAMRGGARSRADIDAEVARGLQAISEIGAARMAGASGSVTEEARRAQFRSAIEDLTVKQLQQVAKQLEVGGVSRLRKADLINKIVADASMEMIKRYLDPQAVMRGGGKGELQRFLDTFARGVFRFLGIDPESLRQRRLPPAIDWPAERPQRRILIGPSSTGRALPPGATPLALPGTAFANQRRLVGNVLTPELKEILRQAANAFVDTVRRELNAAVRTVRVRDLGNTVRAALTGQGVAGLLPPAVGRTPSIYSSGAAGGESRAELFARREREARIRSAARGAAVMAPGLVLPAARDPFAGQAFRAPSVPAGAVPSAQPPRDFFQALRGLSPILQLSRVPLSGAIKEIGEQFGYAIKQVLLFGTAYKALAFFIDLPRQAFEATRSLQTFNNQIRAVTENPEAANRSFAFLGDIVNRLSLPLQNARDGFVQLYASMSPAGMPADEIEGLFEGITSASAALGLSGAEMDRMILALTQMASKGNIAAEEVRQLANVLPSARPLLAEAARMEMDEFVTAMRRGQLSGEALQNTLFNLGVLLRRDFGEGAKGAATTLEGAMNRIGNAVIGMYEEFEPLVMEIAASVVPLLVEGIEGATRGVQAFAASFTNANTPVGELGGTARAVFDALQTLEGLFNALVSIARSLGPTLGQIGQVLLLLLRQVVAFLNTDFGRWFANTAAQVILLTNVATALTGVLTQLASFLLLNLLPRLVAASQGFVAMAQAQGTAAAAAAKLKGALTLLLALLLKFAAPVAIVAIISAIADAFGNAAGRAQELRTAAMGAAEAIRGMSRQEALNAQRQAREDARLISMIGERGDVDIRRGFVEVSEEEKAALARAGIGTERQVTRRRGLGGIVDVVSRERLAGALLSAQGREAEAAHRVRVVDFEGRQQGAGEALRDVTPVAVDAAGAKGREPGFYDSPQIQFLRQRLEIEKQLLESRRQQGLLSQTAFTIATAELELEIAKEMAAERLRLARLEASRANLTEADKALKIKDAEIFAENEEAIATERRNIAVEGARRELEGPLQDALQENTFLIQEQSLLQGNLKEGLIGLTSEQEAFLEVRRMTRNLSEDERQIVSETLELLEKSVQARLEAARATERLNVIEGIRRRTELATILDPQLRRRRELEQEGEPSEFIESVLLAEKEERKAAELTERLTGLANAIGDAFGTAFSDIITGASSVQEVLANAFRNIASSFADMVGEMISQWMRAQVIGLFQNLLPGLGASSGGLGSAASNLAQYAPIPSVVPGFANGGIVTGPTLGLVGEGRYNEAVVPLPDGRSIPVDLGGASGAGGDISTSIVVNVSNGQASSEVSGSQGNQLARELEGAVRQVILKETRPGGIIFSQR